MVVVLIRSNHISGVQVSVHATYTNLYITDVVTSNQYNYHQHPLSTTLVASTLTFTPLIRGNHISGVKVSVLATSVVDSGC
jgi:hypothetical protein